MSVLLEFSLTPTDHGESISPYIARCVKIIENSGLAYKMGPMGTTLEGKTAKEVFEVVEKCLAEIQKDSRRIEGSISLDYRAGGDKRLDSQVASVERRVGHELHV